MTTYVAISDSEVAPDAPITTSLMTRLRNNPLAIQEGDPSAPSILSSAIAQAGKGADGSLTASTVLTGIGYFDFLTMSVLSALTVPVATVIRISGNATLSAVLSVTPRAPGNLSGGALQSTQTSEDTCLTAFGCKFDAAAARVGAGNNPGGSAYGPGGGASNTPRVTAGLFRRWASRSTFPGGNGLGNGSGSGTNPVAGRGGGVVIIIVEGDFDCTGGTIDASGSDSDNVGGGGDDPGAGGGGNVRVICMGKITNGTFKARGGTGHNIPSNGGGGGTVDLVAVQFIGTQTFDVTKGTGATGSSADGSSSTTTLSRDFIRTLIQRLV